jgi:hypothetical protein
VGDGLRRAIVFENEVLCAKVPDDSVFIVPYRNDDLLELNIHAQYGLRREEQQSKHRCERTHH